ncbi:MAG: hypothetical protein NT093_02860 [Candidatus Moranbacteria bacterium]|nr:hypothetical protein [Candidatus Moranbacteria bacterium]
MNRKKIKRRGKIYFWAIGLILAGTALGGFRLFQKNSSNLEEKKQEASVTAKNILPAIETNTESFAGAIVDVPKPPPPPVDMERLKRQGCVADGLLTEYNPDQGEFISLINRSNCYYLHRAIETWREPPDFQVIEKNMAQIAKTEVVYGMFIAEAIGTKDGYKNEDTGHVFDFGEMCHNDTLNDWGEHTCKPTFSSREYRDYLEYITRRAIDLGVQSFTFGQIYMQESSSRNYAPQIVKDIRKYAKEKNVDIVIGAQTGSITDAKYLKLFDYIEGGVGIDSNGDIENGPCFSKRGSCWALLWNKTYASKAKNVLLHLDWTGIPSDDLDIFARMSAGKRAATLQNLYGFFKQKNMGFLMPYFGVLYKDNGGCFGPKKRFYSPSDAYSCKDEKAISKILGGS